ncbi:MAG: leishmanolysin-related zinc metalloendopeptidase, partial [Microcystaceae cyanobacterium]
NDDYYGLQSLVSFNVTAGTTYQIAVDGFGYSTGDIALNLDFDPNSNPDPDSGFDIDINFSGNWTDDQLAIFSEAANMWESVITADIADVYTSQYGLVDDLVIDASSVNIDGEGGILGQAGYTMLRSDGNLPVAGIMQFDSADLSMLEQEDLLLDVIAHEMGHVLGFGTVWEQNGLVIDELTGPQYIGDNALQAYNDIFGINASSVPLANTGGPGTYGSHWNESLFDNELMTGYLNYGDNPMSYITVASLQDIGYEVVAQEDFTDLYTPPSVGGIQALSSLNNLDSGIADLVEYVNSLEMLEPSLVEFV